MKLAKALSLLAVMLILTAGAVGSARAQGELAPESGAVLYSHLYYDFETGLTYTPRGSQVQLAGDVYNNTNPRPAPNFGFSSTDLAAQWGDRLNTTGQGILQENDFTVYNASTNGGSLLTASFSIALFDGTSFVPFGGYTTGTVNFGAGLPVNGFSVITVTGLSSLNINVTSVDVLMRQQIASRTGTANKLGIVSFDPPSIGSSSNTMYINATTVGAAGFYNIGSPPANANPGYRVNLAQPVPAVSKSWGSIKAMYHI